VVERRYHKMMTGGLSSVLRDSFLHLAGTHLRGWDNPPGIDRQVPANDLTKNLCTFACPGLWPLSILRGRYHPGNALKFTPASFKGRCPR